MQAIAVNPSYWRKPEIHEHGRPKPRMAVFVAPGSSLDDELENVLPLDRTGSRPMRRLSGLPRRAAHAIEAGRGAAPSGGGI
jgi:hypothetical protein